MIAALTLAMAGATLSPTLAAPKPWTAHSAAALLDASFASAQACQAALDAARAHERTAPSKPVHDLSYANLFDQARCGGVTHTSGIVWRIRMHWPQRR